MAMDLMERFGTDPVASEQGKWIAIAHNGDGSPKTELLIARLNNSRYREKMAEAIKSLGTNPSDDATAVALNEAIADAVLLGWRGEFTMFGEPVGEYSKARATEIIGDPRLRDFKEYVLRLAQEIENFRVESREADEGN